MTELAANPEQAEHWNADEARHWVDHDHDYDVMLRPLGDRMLAAAAITPGERVLDVGCGCGNTTIAAALAAAPGGAAHGVDLSGPMTDLARRHASDRGVAATFEVADAQVHPWEESSFDVAVSRFGVMFFADPVQAFTNIGRALRPTGRLAFVCWQEMLANEWMLVPGMALAEHVPLPDLGEPGAPGPFAFADPERIRGILDASGYRHISVEPVRETLLIGGGPTVEGTLEFLRTSGMGQTLLADADPEAIAAGLDAVRRALEPHATPTGVRLDGAAWVVTAAAGQT
jgi:SAM-dependent methyltransferase